MVKNDGFNDDVTVVVVVILKLPKSRAVTSTPLAAVMA